MSVKLIKKPLSTAPIFEALEPVKEVETLVVNNDVAPVTALVETELKPEEVQQNNPPPPIESKPKKVPKKSAKSNSTSSKKAPPVRTQEPPRLESQHEEITQEANIEPENIPVESKPVDIKKVEVEVEEREIGDETTENKLRSFAAKWKESIRIPATQPVCSQAQIAMNQCRH